MPYGGYGASLFPPIQDEFCWRSSNHVSRSTRHRSEAKEEAVANASFIDDLGADSLDIVELVMTLEETFDIEIPDDDAEKMQTISDAIGYLKERVEE